MKKFLFLSCIAAMFVLISCASTAQDTSDTQAPVEETPQIEAPAEVQDDSSNSKYKNLLSQTEDARKKALDAKADVEYSDAFKKIDDDFNAIKSLNDGKDHSDELAQIKARYEALESAAKARALKKRIDDEGLSDYSKADYDHGEKALGEFDTMVQDESAKGSALRTKAIEAYDAYSAVFNKAYRKFANDARKNALEQKKRADGVKAQVARKDEYKSYAALITTGDSQYATKNVEGAYNSYTKAASSFKQLADDVEAKRAEAQKKIDEAKAKVKEVENYALNADKVNPLGEKIDGIEDEDTVLLEEDSFASPEDQIIQIDENFEGEVK